MKKSNDSLLKERERAIELLSAYSSLLTKSQKESVESYYSYDLSLAEIASGQNISRAAVNEAIKISLAKMEGYEKDLKLISKRKTLENRISEINKIKDPVKRLEAYETLGKELTNGI